MIMGYDLGMMPTVSKCLCYLVSPEAQTKMSVSQKGSHAIKIANSHTSHKLERYAGSLQTGLRMAGLFIIILVVVLDVSSVYHLVAVRVTEYFSCVLYQVIEYANYDL